MGNPTEERTVPSEGSSSSPLRTFGFIGQGPANAVNIRRYQPNFPGREFPEGMENLTLEEIAHFLKVEVSPETFLDAVVLRPDLIPIMLEAFEELEPREFMRFLTAQDSNGYNALMAMIRNEPRYLPKLLSILDAQISAGADEEVVRILQAVSTDEQMNAFMLLSLLPETCLEETFDTMCTLILRLMPEEQNSILKQTSINGFNALIGFFGKQLSLAPFCKLLDDMDHDLRAQILLHTNLDGRNVLNYRKNVKNTENLTRLLSMALYALSNEQQLKWIGGNENVLMFAARLYPELLKTIFSDTSRTAYLWPFLEGHPSPLLLALESGSINGVRALLEQVAMLGLDQQKQFLIDKGNALIYAAKYCPEAFFEVFDAMRIANPEAAWKELDVVWKEEVPRYGPYRAREVSKSLFCLFINSERPEVLQQVFQSIAERSSEGERDFYLAFLRRSILQHSGTVNHHESRKILNELLEMVSLLEPDELAQFLFSEKENFSWLTRNFPWENAYNRVDSLLKVIKKCPNEKILDLLTIEKTWKDAIECQRTYKTTLLHQFIGWECFGSALKLFNFIKELPEPQEKELLEAQFLHRFTFKDRHYSEKMNIQEVLGAIENKSSSEFKALENKVEMKVFVGDATCSSCLVL